MSIKLKLLQIVSGYMKHTVESIGIEFLTNSGIMGPPQVLEEPDCIMHHLR